MAELVVDQSAFASLLAPQRIQKIVRCKIPVQDHLPGRGLGASRTKETLMKKLVATVSIAAGLAAVIASPALAQNGRQRHVARAPYAASSPYGAYAAAPYGNYRPARPSARAPYSVYDIRGNRVGADPDPTVRDQLARDPTQGD
jgi:hypothetical protein